MAVIDEDRLVGVGAKLDQLVLVEGLDPLARDHRVERLGVPFDGEDAWRGRRVDDARLLAHTLPAEGLVGEGGDLLRRTGALDRRRRHHERWCAALEVTNRLPR